MIIIAVLSVFLPAISFAQSPYDLSGATGKGYRYSGGNVYDPNGTACKWNVFQEMAESQNCTEASRQCGIGRGESIAGIVVASTGIVAAGCGVLGIVGGNQIINSPVSDTMSVAASIIVAVFGKGIVGAMALAGGYILTGVGLLDGIVGTTLIITGTNHLKRSVSEFNSCQGRSSAYVDYSLRFGPTRNGVGLTFSFEPSRR